MHVSVVVIAGVSALLFCPAACWTATAGTTQRSEAILSPTSRKLGLLWSPLGTMAGAGDAFTVTAAEGVGPLTVPGVWLPILGPWCQCALCMSCCWVASRQGAPTDSCACSAQQACMRKAAGGGRGGLVRDWHLAVSDLNPATSTTLYHNPPGNGLVSCCPSTKQC